jgi:CarD family transcriptional regulator
VPPKPAAASKKAGGPAAAVKKVEPAATAPAAPKAAPAGGHAPKAQATPARAMPAAIAAKPATPKLTTPASAPAARPAAPAAHRPPGARPVQPAPATPASAPAAAAAANAGPKKPVNSRHGFKTGESVVYPAHGVGRIIGIEEQEIAGISLELFVIQFEKDKMTLRVPTSKLSSVGMRKLAEDGIVKKAMETLKGRARIKRTMWSRRAQEYEAKINSGDLIAIAEVVRDLYRSEAQPEQSYSERQLYEAALDRMAREIAAVDKSDERGAMQRITEVLSKSAKGRRAAEEEASGAGEEVKAA